MIEWIRPTTLPRGLTGISDSTEPLHPLPVLNDCAFKKSRLFSVTSISGSWGLKAVKCGLQQRMDNRMVSFQICSEQWLVRVLMGAYMRFLFCLVCICVTRACIHVCSCWPACRLIVFSYSCLCLPACQAYSRLKRFMREHQSGTWTLPLISRRSRFSAALLHVLAGGLSAGPIYEMGLSVTTHSD